VVKAMFINKTENPLPTIHTDLFGKLGMVLSTIGMIIIGLWSYIFNWVEAVSFGM
jgi:NADH-quinone oxidoreductase subunit N